MPAHLSQLQAICTLLVRHGSWRIGSSAEAYITLTPQQSVSLIKEPETLHQSSM